LNWKLTLYDKENEAIEGNPGRGQVERKLRSRTLTIYDETETMNNEAIKYALYKYLFCCLRLMNYSLVEDM
jgi:hypothetical protein